MLATIGFHVAVVALVASKGASAWLLAPIAGFIVASVFLLQIRMEGRTDGGAFLQKTVFGFMGLTAAIVGASEKSFISRLLRMVGRITHVLVWMSFYVAGIGSLFAIFLA